MDKVAAFLGAGLACLLAATGTPAAAAEQITLDFAGPLAGAEQLPAPWKLLGHPSADVPSFRVVQDPAVGPAIAMHARGLQADAVYRPVQIDLNRTPYINFCWRVDKHPTGQIGTDRSDQAVKVQLDFGRYGLRRRVLSYVYDSVTRCGAWCDDSSMFATCPALVLDSGGEKLGKWVGHSRDARRDYQSQYRGSAPALQNLSIFCDSNSSNSEAMGYCSAVTFSDRPLYALE